MTSLFKPYKPTENYGFFGYTGFCCDLAIKQDDPAMAEECWRNGWLDLTSETIFGTVLEKCDKAAPKVAAKLRELGPCVSKPELAEAL